MKQHNLQGKCNPAYRLKEDLDKEKNIPLPSQVGGPCYKSTTISFILQYIAQVQIE